MGGSKLLMEALSDEVHGLQGSEMGKSQAGEVALGITLAAPIGKGRVVPV